MDFIIDAIVEWLKGLLVDGIMGNLDGLFDNVNQSVGEIATQVGTTPADWNAGVFSMIRQISETAILPIAGVILTFVMTYELIQMLIERNNLHEIDTWMFFKWVFKTFVAVMILTNEAPDLEDDYCEYEDGELEEIAEEPEDEDTPPWEEDTEE